jgi:hypothetical protein
MEVTKHNLDTIGMLILKRATRFIKHIFNDEYEELK